MNDSISAYILAGGKSSRMGEDKGLLLLMERPLISYIIEEIKKITEDITIITSNNKYQKFHCRTIEDHFLERGPAAGVDTALQDAKHPTIFITGCDMPLLDAESISLLVKKSRFSEITMVKNKDFIEPMFTIYQKACKNKWRELLLNHTLKLSNFFSHFDTNFVDADAFLISNPHLFFNVNTPIDLSNASKWMKK